MSLDSESSKAVPESAKKPRRLRALAVGAVIAFGLVVPGGVVQPDRADAHTSCYDFWQKSGHTARAQWHHCHDFKIVDKDDVQARVHICGYSGTLHGITVRHHHRNVLWDFWSRTDARDDPGGEGCRRRR